MQHVDNDNGFGRLDMDQERLTRAGIGHPLPLWCQNGTVAALRGAVGNRRTSVEKLLLTKIRLARAKTLDGAFSDLGEAVGGFGLIDSFKIVRRDEEGEESVFGRMTRVEIKLSDWTFRAVKSMEVLSISRDYFRLRRPLERRL